MKQFLITYRFKNGSEDEWHRNIATFIAAIDADPELTGKMTYRCMKASAGPEYYHLATVVDDDTVKTLQSREFFTRYTGQTDHVADGDVEVVPLTIVAETAPV